MKQFSITKTGICLLASIGVGCIFTTVFELIFRGSNTVVRSFAIWMGASVLYGTVSLLIYRDDCRFSLLLKTVLHCLLCFGITIAAVFLNDYGLPAAMLWTVALPFLVIYAVIYLCCYLHARKEAEQLNEKLKQR